MVDRLDKQQVNGLWLSQTVLNRQWENRGGTVYKLEFFHLPVLEVPYTRITARERRGLVEGGRLQ
jgi:hypothetical protein